MRLASFASLLTMRINLGRRKKDLRVRWRAEHAEIFT
jgi:hypothetical protein